MEEMSSVEQELFLEEVSDHEGTSVKNEWTGRGLISYRLFFPVCPDDWILRKECSKARNLMQSYGIFNSPGETFIPAGNPVQSLGR